MELYRHIGPVDITETIKLMEPRSTDAPTPHVKRKPTAAGRKRIEKVKAARAQSRRTRRKRK